MNPRGDCMQLLSTERSVSNMNDIDEGRGGRGDRAGGDRVPRRAGGGCGKTVTAAWSEFIGRHIRDVVPMLAEGQPDVGVPGGSRLIEVVAQKATPLAARPSFGGGAWSSI
jgi:hypothetical protein